MKLSFLLCFLCISFLSIYCGNSNNSESTSPSEDLAEIKFTQDTLDVGVIEAGKIATLSFHFKNTGGKPLNISYARGNCHCVQPKWPESAIAPGDSSVIDVSFDPENVKGLFIRTLYVLSDAKTDSVNLVFQGDIQDHTN